MSCKPAMFLGLSALLMVLMVDQAESRLVPQEVRSLVELLREDQEDIAPEENAMAARGLDEHDTDQDQKTRRTRPDADTNGDGSIDRAEFDAASGQFGGDGGDQTDLARRTVEKARALLEQLRGEQEDIARGLAEHGTDQDQKLSKAEILAMMTKNGISVEDLPENWFEDADTNGDGSIDRAEFDAASGQFGGDGGDQTDLARRIAEKARGLLELLREGKRDRYRGGR
ncbi:Hypp4421 [Branchiostoma lanceolatum]|uniref:Hypp4421 protein n=1 Tax=Branchiostoma lanceolatum TaxID=7740 RepID=A0A8K0EY48_BRALA|nr:Hypp4421 [Branchiostoma lanceolatum]